MINKIIKIHEKAQLTTYLTTPNDKRKRPAIVICPGGGYVDTTPNEAECVALEFIRSNYQCFVLDYSTYNRNHGHSYYPKPLYELASAIDLIKNNSDEWYVDSDKIFLLGFSAGGNLVANYGNRWKDLANNLKLDPEQLKITGLILCYPAIDWAKEIEDLQRYVKDFEMDIINGDANKLMATKILVERANFAMFNTINPTSEQIKDVSPCYSVNDNTPPTFIWHTRTDDMVSIKQIYNYVNILLENNISHELHVFSNGPHGLSLANKFSATKTKNIDMKINQWVNLSLNWLSRFE